MAQPRISRRDLLADRRPPGRIAGGRWSSDLVHRGQNSAAVSLAKGSWMTVVAICLIAAVLLAVGGYTGYSIVVAAVGLAAAVNLI